MLLKTIFLFEKYIHWDKISVWFLSRLKEFNTEFSGVAIEGKNSGHGRPQKIFLRGRPDSIGTRWGCWDKGKFYTCSLKLCFFTFWKNTFTETRSPFDFFPRLRVQWRCHQLSTEMLATGATFWLPYSIYSLLNSISGVVAKRFH